MLRPRVVGDDRALGASGVPRPSSAREYIGCIGNTANKIKGDLVEIGSQTRVVTSVASDSA